MNIFVLDENPCKAVTMLCDCHLRKMCVETSQILSGVMLRRGILLLDGMPKPQNINHPVIVAAATGFPADYQFAGGDTAAKKMIGNAVCPPLAEALLKAVLAA